MMFLSFAELDGFTYLCFEFNREHFKWEML